MVAYYCQGSSKLLPFIELRETPGSEVLETITVSGKRDARKVAKARNAKCWNF